MKNKLKPLTDFRWATVRSYVQSDLGKTRDAGTAAVFAFAAIALTETREDEMKLHSDMQALHNATIAAGMDLTNEQAKEVSDYINEVLGLAEAAEVDTPEGKP
jgi:hypothetical protein